MYCLNWIVIKVTLILQKIFGFNFDLLFPISGNQYFIYINRYLLLQALYFLGFSFDDNNELFLWYGWPTSSVQPYFQPGPLSEILATANLRHAASRVWTCTEPEFRFIWMKFYSSDNTCTSSLVGTPQSLQKQLPDVF